MGNLSAFGIDHGGEVAKAYIPGRGTVHMVRSARANKRAKAAGKHARQVRAEKVAGTIRTSAQKASKVPGKLVNAEVSVAGIGRGVGSATTKVGEGINTAVTKYPGSTGTAVLGGGGYALYRSGRKKNKKPEGM